MAMKVGQLDFSGWPLQNVVLDSRSTPPASPKHGQVYFDIIEEHYKYWSNEGWKTLYTQDEVEAAIGELQDAIAAVDVKVGSVTGPSPVLIFENGLV